ncbi:hypothetical protein C4552_00770 [Candidatus Parcubacteria bacterium]|nr:MAG: hypothetical protein C4552_00770 [Candidatus Parcubacteria bacterium]
MITASARRGVTALELLLAIALVAIIATLLASGFSLFRRSVAVGAATETTLAVLAEARSRTLGSRDAASWGVHFETSRIVLYKGPAFSEGAAGNEVTALGGDVRIATIALAGGGSDVLFDRLTGATSQAGTITIEHAHDASRFRVITVLATGIASL